MRDVPLAEVTRHFIDVADIVLTDTENDMETPTAPRPPGVATRRPRVTCISGIRISFSTVNRRFFECV
ncbi:hypothetical protein [Burkholderia ambifaria]|uniref:hypothetical protein n=1 Tax=Burkholderia ambifaria TaxID=152480 RepID=UPI002FE3FDF7